MTPEDADGSLPRAILRLAVVSREPGRLLVVKDAHLAVARHRRTVDSQGLSRGEMAFQSAAITYMREEYGSICALNTLPLWPVWMTVSHLNG